MLFQILSVRQWYISSSSCATTYFTKKYLFLICLLHLDLENLPLCSKSMALLLYCTSLLCEILYPCDSVKYIEHSILAMVLSTPDRSSPMEIFLFIFCIVDNMHTNTFYREITDPVCPKHSSYISYEASTQHFTTEM